MRIIFCSLLVLLCPLQLFAEDPASAQPPALTDLSKNGAAIFGMPSGKSPSTPPVKLPATTPSNMLPDLDPSTLRDASVTDAEKKAMSAPSELDAELPLNADPQITRWLVQAAILEKQAVTKKNNDNLNERLKLYEEIAVRACAPAFLSNFTVPSPLPTDSACLATIQKIKDIHATNPTVACLETGIKSPICALYTNQQRVGTTEVSNRDSALYRLMVGTAEPSAIKGYKDLQSQVEKALRTPVQEITPPQLNSIRSYLAVTCKEYRIGTEYLPAETIQETDPSKRALLQDIESLSKKSVVATPGQQALRLVRLLPEPCSTTIASLKKIKLSLAAATCYEQGPLAPQCIQALQFERYHPVIGGQNKLNEYNNATPGSPAKDPGHDSLQSF